MWQPYLIPWKFVTVMHFFHCLLHYPSLRWWSINLTPQSRHLSIKVSWCSHSCPQSNSLTLFLQKTILSKQTSTAHTSTSLRWQHHTRTACSRSNRTTIPHNYSVALHSRLKHYTIWTHTTLQRNSSHQDSVQLVCLSSNERCKVNDMIKYYTTKELFWKGFCSTSLPLFERETQRQWHD